VVPEAEAAVVDHQAGTKASIPTGRTRLLTGASSSDPVVSEPFASLISKQQEHAGRTNDLATKLIWQHLHDEISDDDDEVTRPSFAQEPQHQVAGGLGEAKPVGLSGLAPSTAPSPAPAPLLLHPMQRWPRPLPPPSVARGGTPRTTSTQVSVLTSAPAVGVRPKVWQRLEAENSPQYSRFGSDVSSSHFGSDASSSMRLLPRRETHGAGSHSSSSIYSLGQLQRSGGTSEQPLLQPFGAPSGWGDVAAAEDDEIDGISEAHGLLPAMGRSQSSDRSCLAGGEESPPTSTPASQEVQLTRQLASLQAQQAAQLREMQSLAQDMAASHVRGDRAELHVLQQVQAKQLRMLQLEQAHQTQGLLVAQQQQQLEVLQRQKKEFTGQDYGGSALCACCILQ